VSRYAPTCFATSPSTAQVCRDCGHVFAPPERREIKVVKGELVEAQIQRSPKPRFYPGDLVMHHQTKLKYRVKDMSEDDSYVILQESPRSFVHCNVWALELINSAHNFKREQSSARDLEALRELAQQRGYKRGWAERVYQARLAKRHGI
jgi:ASC-1-like (ASCH) protein